MLKMDFDLVVQNFYAAYTLPPPEDEVLAAMYNALKKYPDDAIRYAAKEFQEDNERITRGMNVTTALKRYAEKWRAPNAPRRVVGTCPDGCRHGLFYVRHIGAGSTYIVVPCARCAPDMPGASTRSALESAGKTLLDVRTIISGDFHTQQAENIEDSPWYKSVRKGCETTLPK